jgi:glycosyltransferase involved in cell wall biosynthesis
MRPYLIVAGDFVRTGGMDHANHALASYLARTGRAVDIVGCRVANDLARSKNVTVHLVPRPLNAHALGAPLLAGVGLACATSVSRRGGAVLVNGGNCPFPAANWVHYVHSAHAPVVGGGGWRSAKARMLHAINCVSERIALGLARVILTNSERTRLHVVERVSIPADRVRTVYLAVDAERFRPATSKERSCTRKALGWESERLHIAFIGALGDRRKGFDIVYDAWLRLCRSKSWDADLVVIGSGAELSAWRGRAQRDSVANRITFLGFRSDVPQVLAACDALVAPSRYEPYGLAAHEALCCGLPAFVSATAGVAERYPQFLNSLLLADPESADALAAALLRWRNQVSQVRADVLLFSQSLRARSWDDMARDIVALCDSQA